MSKITVDDVKNYLASGGKLIAELALDVYGESINRAGETAFSDAIEIGIGNTILALIDANVIDDEIIRVINKYWGINQDEAEKRIVFEKGNLAINELKRYLRMQGRSDNEIHQFMVTNRAAFKIRHNPHLWELRYTPNKLAEAIQE